MRAFGAGDLTARIHLRDKDMFQDEASEINGGLAQLNASIAELKLLAAEVQASHASGGDAAQAIDKLSQALDGLITETEG